MTILMEPTEKKKKKDCFFSFEQSMLELIVIKTISYPDMHPYPDIMKPLATFSKNDLYFQTSGKSY